MLFRARLAISPDGRYLAYSVADRTVRVWDLQAWREAFAFRGHAGDVMALAFSPDGRRLASGGKDGTVKVWDLTREPEVRVLAPAGGLHGGLALDADGRRLAMASSRSDYPADEEDVVLVLDATTRREALRLRGCNDVAFSPDGRWLATGTPEGVVALWDAATGKATPHAARRRSRLPPAGHQPRREAPGHRRDRRERPGLGHLPGGAGPLLVRPGGAGRGDGPQSGRGPAGHGRRRRGAPPGRRDRRPGPPSGAAVLLLYRGLQPGREADRRRHRRGDPSLGGPDGAAGGVVPRAHQHRPRRWPSARTAGGWCRGAWTGRRGSGTWSRAASSSPCPA